MSLIFLVIGLCCAISWVYAHPPLAVRSVGRYEGETHSYYLLELNNTGLMPVYMTGVTVSSGSIPFEVVGINGSATLLARPDASKLENLPGEFEIRSVDGWRVPGASSSGDYTIRIDWEAGPAPDDAIVISYRYSGLPMMCTLEACR